MKTAPEADSVEAFVEELGELFDRIGSPRISGRIVGWLLVCEPPFQSADQIRTAVRASKGSVSTVVRQLVSSGLVERLGLPGDRKSYYRIREDGWTALMEAKLRFTRSFEEVGRRWLGVLEGTRSTGRLRAMVRLYGFFADSLDETMGRWAAEPHEEGRDD